MTAPLLVRWFTIRCWGLTQAGLSPLCWQASKRANQFSLCKSSQIGAMLRTSIRLQPAPCEPEGSFGIGCLWRHTTDGRDEAIVYVRHDRKAFADDRTRDIPP